MLNTIEMETRTVVLNAIVLQTLHPTRNGSQHETGLGTLAEKKTEPKEAREADPVTPEKKTMSKEAREADPATLMMLSLTVRPGTM